jgi:hypothetical protein
MDVEKKKRAKPERLFSPFSPLSRWHTSKMLQMFVAAAATLLLAAAWPAFAFYSAVSSQGVTWADARQQCLEAGNFLADVGTPTRNGEVATALVDAFGQNGAQNGLYWTSGHLNRSSSTLWTWATSSERSGSSQLSFYNEADGGVCVFSPLFCTWAGGEPAAAASPELGLALRRRSVDGAVEWYALPVNSGGAQGYVCKTSTSSISYSGASGTRTREKTGTVRSASLSPTASRPSVSVRAGGSSRTRRTASPSLTSTITQSVELASGSWSLSSAPSESVRSFTADWSRSAETASLTQTTTKERHSKTVSVLSPTFVVSPSDPPVLQATDFIEGGSGGGSGDAVEYVTIRINVTSTEFFPLAWGAEVNGSGGHMTASCLVVTWGMGEGLAAEDPAKAALSWISETTLLSLMTESTETAAGWSKKVAVVLFKRNTKLFNALKDPISFDVGIAPLCLTRPESNIFFTVTILRPPERVATQPLSAGLQQTLALFSLGSVLIDPFAMLHAQQLSFVFDAELCNAPKHGRRHYSHLPSALRPLSSSSMGTSEVADYVGVLVVSASLIAAAMCGNLLVVFLYRRRETCMWREARSGAWFPSAGFAVTVSFCQPVLVSGIVVLMMGEDTWRRVCIAAVLMVCLLATCVVCFTLIYIPVKLEWVAAQCALYTCARWAPLAVQQNALKVSAAAASGRRVSAGESSRLHVPPCIVKSPWLAAAACSIEDFLVETGLLGKGCWQDRRLAAPQSACRQSYSLIALFRLPSSFGPWYYAVLAVGLGLLLSVLDGFSSAGYSTASCGALLVVAVVGHATCAVVIVVWSVFRSRPLNTLSFLMHASIALSAAAVEIESAPLASAAVHIAAICIVVRCAITILLLLATVCLLLGTYVQDAGISVTEFAMTDSHAEIDAANKLEDQSTGPTIKRRRRASEDDLVLQLPMREATVVHLASLAAPPARALDTSAQCAMTAERRLQLLDSIL